MSIPSIPLTPQNPNLLHPNKFILQVLALPDVKYWCQSVNLPGISIGEAIRSTPFIDLYSPGEKAILNPLAVTFLIDEDMRGWLEVFTWMTSLSFPKNFQQYQQLGNRFDAYRKNMPQFSDITLTILNTKQNPTYRVKYYNCFPTSLSDVVFSAQASPEEPMTADVTFRYDIFEIEKVNVNVA